VYDIPNEPPVESGFPASVGVQCPFFRPKVKPAVENPAESRIVSITTMRIGNRGMAVVAQVRTAED
jgi:hypothetical protein